MLDLFVVEFFFGNRVMWCYQNRCYVSSVTPKGINDATSTQMPGIMLHSQSGDCIHRPTFIRI